MTGTLVSSLPVAATDAHAGNGAALPGSPRDQLRRAIDAAAQYLPLQGPLTVFVAMNTLEAFENRPYDEGVRAAQQMYGCEPYLPEARYREKFERGRIRVEDLTAVLRADLGPAADEPVLSFGSRFDICMSMLRFPLQQATGDELSWFVADTDALRVFRQEAPFAVRRRVIQETQRWIRNASMSSSDSSSNALPGAIDALLRQQSVQPPDRWDEAAWEAFTLESLWRICRQGIHAVREPRAKARLPLRHRDALLHSVGHDSDLLVHELLIRFCASFLDQGFASWPLPLRDQGFAAAFAGLYGTGGISPERWRVGIARRAAAFQSPEFDPLDSIAESLQLLGVPEPEWSDYLTATCLALRGWAGMIWRVECRGDRVPRPIPAGSLVQYLAVRLVLECAALEYLACEHLGFDGPLSELKSACRVRQFKPARERFDQRAFVLFQLAQLLGWLPQDLGALSQDDWALLIREVEAFGELERRRVFHAAFERNYRIQVLDALSFRSRLGPQATPAVEYQVICCLDDREEGFRRQLEEVSAETQTYGVAGFFNIPMYYRGVADAYHVPLCPIVIRPSHWVNEEVHERDHGTYAKQTSARRIFGLTAHQLQQRSHTFWGGALIAAGLGALASVPLVARVLFPRLAAQLRSSAGLWVVPRNTRLKLRREDPTPAPTGGGVGFTLEELAACGERMLRDIGLTANFGSLVVIAGHGSSSLNNPHRSAYDCGACGGASGGPNARAMAELLNDPNVRARLEARGIAIPPTTFFLGALHNTCNDRVTLFDQDGVPATHREALEQFRRILDETCRRNAHERSRRFRSADLQASFAEAHKHVEARSEDLAQARPEFGHSTVAVCVVGRRTRTRGLFMDRRSFLVSYDPTQDDAELTLLARIMTPVVPVCVGICMQYFYSYLDSPGWGSGSKLPHNVTAMLGVMDGMASDLRTGLPWQAVEIHEPLRLLFVLEMPFDKIGQLFAKVPMLEQLTRNGWIQLTLLDPDSDRIVVYQNGEFRPHEPEAQLIPRAASSWEWYRGSRDHLGFAVIE